MATVYGRMAFGLLCVAQIAFAASAAAALPEFLGVFPTTLTGTSGKAVFETGAGAFTQVPCAKGKYSGLITSKKGGTFMSDFEEGVNATGEACNSLGSAQGTISVMGNLELVTIKSTDGGFVLLVNLATHVICHTILGEVLLVIWGAVVTLSAPVNSKTTKFGLNITGSKGKKEFTNCDVGEPCGKPITLEMAINGGAFEEADINAAEGKLTMAKELAIMV